MPSGSQGGFPSFPRVVKRADPLSYFFLGLILVSLGLSILMAQLGFLKPLEAASLFFSLLAIVLWSDAIARYARPWTRHKSLPLAFSGSLSAALAISLLLGISAWWPLLLVAVGACSLAHGLLGLRKRLRR